MSMDSVVAIIPALDEAGSIGEVVSRIPRPAVSRVIVVDGGSRDETVHRARAAGAEVIVEPRPGYGRACAAGVSLARLRGAEVLAFADGALCEDPAELGRILEPIAAGRADFVLGARVGPGLERGAMPPWQRAGNALVCAVIAALWGHRYRDLGPMRAIRADALDLLEMSEPAHGWPAEMQVKAARRGLRVVEVPISYRPRLTGRSKVSGSPIGALRAGAALLRVAATGGGGART